MTLFHMDGTLLRHYRIVALDGFPEGILGAVFDTLVGSGGAGFRILVVFVRQVAG